MTKLPVVAAVPNYNMAESLKVLLPQLDKESYSDIFVLDDSSTDDSKEVVRSLGTRAIFIESTKNTGAGATRNRILNALTYDALIHFIDADTSLLTADIETVANDSMPDEPVGFIGGLVRKENGVQHELNYGRRQGLRSAVAGSIQKSVSVLLENGQQERAFNLRMRHHELLKDLPVLTAEPVRREVYWNIEQNLLFDSRVFNQLGGFDERLREHEIQDLAIRIANLGLKNYFDPRLSVQQNSIDVRTYNRPLRMLKDEFTIARKHGLLNWIKN